MPELSANAELLLVRRLACLESPWRPLRREYASSPQVHAARGTSGFVAWGDSSDSRRRKFDQRVRDELAGAGLMRGTSLTVEGVKLARSWTWPYSPAELFEALDRIDQRSKAGDCRHDGYVPETLIVGAKISAWPEPFQELQGLLMPMLADGNVKAASTVQGKAFYRLADSFLWPEDRETVLTSIPADIDDLRDKLVDAYIAEYRAAWRRILADDRNYQDIGECPLPCGMGLRSGRKDEDLTDIEPLFSATLASTPNEG